MHWSAAAPLNDIAATCSKRLINPLQARWTKILRLWYAVQLPHYGGKYSIERMLALEEYVRTTSRLRVAMVILTPPAVTIAIVIAQESVPLQDPAAGWKANYGFWIRVGSVGVVLSYFIANQVKVWLRVAVLSSRQVLVFSICVGASLITVGMIIAEVWVFPVPFFMYVPSIPVWVILIGVLRAVVGEHAFREMRSRRGELSQLLKVGKLLGVRLFAYPGIQVLYGKLSHTSYEPLVLLLLYTFKVMMKGIFLRIAPHRDDILPEQIIFSVDIFDALYLATFLPNLAVTSVVGMLIFDLVDTAIELRELHHRARRGLMELRVLTSISAGFGGSNDLLAAVRSLSYSSAMIQTQQIRVRSCTYHQLSSEGRTLLQKLDSTSFLRLHHREDITLHASSPLIPGPGGSSIAVQPYSPTVDLTKQEVRPSQKVDDTSRALMESLQVLFTTECLILTEYLEFVIPALYSGFVLVITRLSSAQYHAEMEGITRDNVNDKVFRTFLYALLELASFVALAIVMWQNCRIQALYQLAFVLETQKSLILSKLISLILVTLTFRVAHFSTFNGEHDRRLGIALSNNAYDEGSDFSFQFAWIKDAH